MTAPAAFLSAWGGPSTQQPVPEGCRFANLPTARHVNALDRTRRHGPCGSRGIRELRRRPAKQSREDGCERVGRACETFLSVRRDLPDGATCVDRRKGAKQHTTGNRSICCRRAMRLPKIRTFRHAPSPFVPAGWIPQGCDSRTSCSQCPTSTDPVGRVGGPQNASRKL